MLRLNLKTCLTSFVFMSILISLVIGEDGNGFFTVTWVTRVILGSCWTTFVFLCNIDFFWRDCREFIPIAFDYIKPPLSVRWLVYIVQLGSFLTECVSSKVTVCNAVTCHISLLYDRRSTNLNANFSRQK